MRSLFRFATPPGPPPSVITPLWWYLAAPVAFLTSLWAGTFPVRHGWPVLVGYAVVAGCAAVAALGLCALWQWRARRAIRRGEVGPTTPPPFTRGTMVIITIAFSLMACWVFWGAGLAI
jgi:hypothetical protein